MSKRVVVTGMGVVSPLGSDLGTFWDNLSSGRSGIETITSMDMTPYPAKIGGPVKGYKLEDFVDRKETRRMDQYVQFAMGASVMAMADAGLEAGKNIAPENVGVILGSGVGGLKTYEQQFEIALKRGPQRISPLFIPMMISDMASGMVSMRLKAKGPNFACVSACASAAHSLGISFRAIQHGEAEAMVTGGAEAALCMSGFGGFSSARALSTRDCPPEKASCPFDKKRDGFVMGEGAGTIILESLDHAKARGAKIYCEVMGYGFTGDAHHITEPALDGPTRSMNIALNMAGKKPEDVDYINAHGTSTQKNDSNETQAIKEVLGEHARKVKISSSKSMTGHLLGAAAAIEFVATALAITNSRIPPTINYEDPDPECDLDYTPNQAVDMPVNFALSNSFGFGGHNATLALQRYAE